MAERPAEIAERDAGGRVAALYAQIRRDSGSPLVNYVWRHLATIDGAAEWAWAVARSNTDPGALASLSELADTTARHIVRRSAVPTDLALGPAGRSIVAAYNSNNVTNLLRVSVVMTALKGLGEGPVAGQGTGQGKGQGAGRGAAPPAGPATGRDGSDGGRLPALPAPDDLSAAERLCLARLERAGPASDSGIPPSLWRHLGVVPGLVARLTEAMEPVLLAQPFQAGYDALRLKAGSLALRCTPPVPAPTGFDRHAALDGLDRFRRRIAELTLAGRILIAWDAAAAAPATDDANRNG